MNRQLFRYHPRFGYHFIPGMRSRVDHEGGGYLVRTNEAGFRSDREFSQGKAAGIFRILLFGDSNTAGDGVSNGHRMSDQIEQLLAGTEVYNFGLSGSGTDQQLLIFREYRDQIPHDLVVIAYYLENIYRVSSRYRPYGTGDGKLEIRAKPYFELDGTGALSLHHVPVPKKVYKPEEIPSDTLYQPGRLTRLRRAVRQLGLKDLAQAVTRYQPLPAYDDPEGAAWRLQKALLSQWATESAAPVVLFLVPIHQYIEGTAEPGGYRARFAELAGTSNLEVVDPLDELRTFAAEDRRGFRFGQDSHFTRSGHRALAEALLPTVKTFREHLLDSRI